MAEPTPLPTDPIAEAHRHWHDHGWSDAADGMAAVTAIMRTQQILLARIEAALKPFDLTFSRFELLRLLSFTRHGSLPMAFASARLQVHPTSVTNAVDRLEAAHLVRRMPHPTDGRATLVEITPAGRERVDAATVQLNERIFRRPGFGTAGVEQLNALLTDFRRDAGDFAE